MKIMLTGANGQVGKCLRDRFPKSWNVLCLGSHDLDITNYDLVFTVVEKFKPDVIINSAAYTAVDKAELEKDEAYKVNSVGPENLAKVSSLFSARIIHLSTDYVFDGEAELPYKESDITNPIGVYGETKLQGEGGVIKNNNNSIIIRTSWVFSEYGNNFVKTMLKLKDKEELNIVADQLGCPTYAGDIARSIIELIGVREARGIYNYSGERVISWYDFSRLIFEIAVKCDYISKAPILNPVTTEEYITLAKRPKMSVLNCNKIKKIGVHTSDWEKQLNEVIKKILI